MNNNLILLVLPNLIVTKNYVSIGRRLWTGIKNVFRENRIFWVPEKRYEVDTIGKNAVPDVVYNISEKRPNWTCRGLSYRYPIPFFASELRSPARGVSRFKPQGGGIFQKKFSQGGGILAISPLGHI